MMNNRIYKYFFHEFINYFLVILFASVSVIWTIQAVNFLDLVTDDGHAFTIYLTYSLLILPKMLTKLIPFSFFISAILTISKLEKDNELIILWTSGLNKIHIVNLIFRISLLVMIIQLFMSCFITPKTLNISRTLLKNSELQFIPSLLKEKKFNDAVEGLTIFVEEKNIDKEYKNIFIRDEGNILTKISQGSSTIFAKSGYLAENEKSLILKKGSIQKIEANGSVNIINFDKTSINFSGLSTKSIVEPKIQETTTLKIIQCMRDKSKNKHNCGRHREERKDVKIEMNKRFGMPMYIPMIGLVSCFLLSSRKDKKLFLFNKYIYLIIISLLILIFAEISVRYSGLSLNHTILYYFIPIGMLPLIYISLIKKFKYENLN